MADKTKASCAGFSSSCDTKSIEVQCHSVHQLTLVSDTQQNLFSMMTEIHKIHTWLRGFYIKGNKAKEIILALNDENTFLLFYSSKPSSPASILIYRNLTPLMFSRSPSASGSCSGDKKIIVQIVYMASTRAAPMRWDTLSYMGFLKRY